VRLPPRGAPSCWSISSGSSLCPPTAAFEHLRSHSSHYSTAEEELYDLAKDPRQLQNVALRGPSKTAQMRALTGSLCRPVPPGFLGSELVPSCGVVLAETIADLASNPPDRVQALARRSLGQPLDLTRDQSECGTLIAPRALRPMKDVRIVFAELGGELHPERDAGDQKEQGSELHGVTAYRDRRKGRC
jgi:hypothetical protein